jgi:hypothetical protein
MLVDRARVAGFEGIDPGGEITIDDPTFAVSNGNGVSSLFPPIQAD